MSKVKRPSPAVKPDALFDRVVSILDQARGNVVRAVNTNMVLAYWLIGREIVEEIQRGKGRAEYGEKVVETLSKQLTERYGKGFSAPVLWNFRQFYMTYDDRITILSPLGRELPCSPKLSPAGRESLPAEKVSPPGSQFPRAFSPQLSWSHYRALMRVENAEARDFYEREAIAGGLKKQKQYLFICAIFAVNERDVYERRENFGGF
ncbi:MAG: hypothetical protein IT393_05215 [Nitrospirae bacterium]|nr:hypothetical protein [Nitrospirota bacterium]